jgi:hypothetical protein
MNYDSMKTLVPSGPQGVLGEVEEAVEEEEGNNPFYTPFANDFLDGATDAHPHAYFQERKLVFADRFDGACTHAEKLSIRLLAILRCIGAPNYVYMGRSWTS